MCNSCRYSGRRLRDCSDGRGPSTPSPPAPPARPVQLTDRPPVSSRSSGRSHRSGGSGQSHPSAASGSTVDSTATINSVHSLQSLARQLSRELHSQETLIATLRAWLSTVNPEAYRQNLPWSPEVLAAYDEYKRLVKEHATAHIAYENARRQSRKNATPEEHLERARLALRWGEAAVSAAEGRLAFLNEYRYAYSSTSSIESHIDTGEKAVSSGRNAVYEARRNYEALWRAYSRNANPQVFE